MVEIITQVLLPTEYFIQQWNNFENQFRFDNVIDKVHEHSLLKQCMYQLICAQKFYVHNRQKLVNNNYYS